MPTYAGEGAGDRDRRGDEADRRRVREVRQHALEALDTARSHRRANKFVALRFWGLHTLQAVEVRR